MLQPSVRLRALGLSAALTAGALVALASPAVADAAATVTSLSSYVDRMGTRHLVGEVKNTGGVDIQAPHIDFAVKDAGGNTVDTPFADAVVSVLAPGESSPFEAQTDAAGFARYDVVAILAPTSRVRPNHNLSVNVTNVFRDGSGNRQISGTVRNDNLTDAADPQVVFTFYDARGEVVGSDVASTDTGAPIAPGATASFSEVVNPELPAYARYASLSQSSSPADPNPSAPPPSNGPPPAETTLDCNPRMTLSTRSIVTGQGVTVNVAGTPGSYVTLEGYSRPSTDYAPIRRDVQLDGAGTVPPFVVKPSTAARIRLQVRGCSDPGTGQVIQVTPVLTVTATRVGSFQYRFAGKISPAVANTGRAISLYYQASSGGPVRKGIARSAKDGTYAATLTFLRGPTQRLNFFWGTGADMTNTATTSAVRSLLVF